MTRRDEIIYKTPEQVEKMRVACRLVHEGLRRASEACQPGATTAEVDAAAESVLDGIDAIALFKDYPGVTPFPASTCISVNDEVVHGIPGERVIEDGDIVSIDFGVKIDGWCGDSATTVMVGNVDGNTRHLCEVTEHVLAIAIQNIRPGVKWSKIAGYMENYARRAKLGIVRDFVGHGIGESLHEQPKVPNFVSRELRRRDIELKAGMVLAIEPMCCLGGDDVRVLGDHWTVATVDGRPAAHYEHTIAVTDGGCDVLTNGS